jgi:hypothetical protein
MIEKTVPVTEPRTPSVRIAIHLATVKAQGREMPMWGRWRHDGLASQNVRSWRIGGKMKARAVLATAPMSVMRPSRSGITNANPAVVKERERE